MKIWLLIYDDGFDRKVARASFDGSKVYQLEKELNGDDNIGPYFSYPIDVEDIPVDDTSLKTVELAIAANGGEILRKEWCRCESGDPITPPFDCEYCAIRNALLESRRILTECFGMKRRKEEFGNNVCQMGLNLIFSKIKQNKTDLKRRIR